MCFPLVVAAQDLGHGCYYLSGFWYSSLCFNNNGILAKFWSVKYINPTCWLKMMSILRKGFCCTVACSMFLYPFAFDPAFLINFDASFFWFCTISLKKRAGSFCFIVFCFMSVVFVFGYLLSVL